ncbi:MAG TPA: type I restriction endonuclease subunit S [Ignavibacteria bacterium]|nr:type I restriction endonuclease subunit S [Ignavibacteria bacterium]
MVNGELSIMNEKNNSQFTTHNSSLLKKGWVEKSLGDIAEIRDGTHQTPKYVKQGIPFYSVENVTADDFINVKMISPEEHTFLTKNWKIERGDILMTRIGSIGVCKHIDWDINASFYVSLALLKIKKDYSAKFITQYSQYKYFKENIILNSLQFAYPQKINLGEIHKVKLIIPESLEEQTRIAQILSDMDSEIEKLETQLSKYKMIKTGMMQELLTGEKRLI